MYLSDLHSSILNRFHMGADVVFSTVETWLEERGFRENDFEDPVFIDRQRLEILRQGEEAIRKQAFQEGVDHVFDQLRLINPYGDRNGFLDD